MKAGAQNSFLPLGAGYLSYATGFIAIEEVRNYGKIVYIKKIFGNGWWEDAYPSSYPLAGSPPVGSGANFGDALIRHCPPRYEKQAENITIYLQRLNRRNGKNAAVLEKQVLMFDEKKDLKI